MATKTPILTKLEKSSSRSDLEGLETLTQGLARVRIGSKWGYIDKNGLIAIKPQFDRAENFADGLARIRIGSKWGYIDKIGNQIIPPQFDRAANFDGGVALVVTHGKIGYLRNPLK